MCNVCVNCNGKFLLKKLEILSLSKYSWSIRLQIVLLGTKCMHCLLYLRCNFFAGGNLTLNLSKYSWSIGLLILWLEIRSFVRQAWSPLSDLFKIKNYCSKQAWCALSDFRLIWLQIVFLRTQRMHYLFYLRWLFFTTGNLSFELV